MTLYYQYFDQFSDYGKLTFLALVGALALIIAGIPAMTKEKPVGMSNAKHWLTRIAILIYGVVGIYSAAFILVPLYSETAGRMIVLSLFFAAMFMLRLVLASPGTPGRAWSLVLSPFLFSLAAYFWGGSVILKLKFFQYNLFADFLFSGLIIYAGFWLSWPLALRSLGGEKGALKNNLKEHTILTLIGLLFILGIWFFGVYYSYQVLIEFVVASDNILTRWLWLGLILQIVNESVVSIQNLRGKL